MSSVVTKRVLLLGASGMLGGYLIKILSSRFKTYSPKPRSGTTCLQTENIIWLSSLLDISDWKSVEGLLSESKPDVIINCIAVTPHSKSASDPIENIKINSLFPHLLARLARVHGSKLIHFSTDGVFSGKQGNYTENDLPDPPDIYGRSKLLGEVREDGCLILRTTFYGLSPNNSGLINWLLAQRGTTVKGYKNYIFSGLSMKVLGTTITSIIERPVFPSGLYHLGGAAISKYDLLTMVSEKFRLGIMVGPDLTPVVNRSLNSSRFWELIGEAIPQTVDMIDEMQLEYQQHC